MKEGKGKWSLGTGIIPPLLWLSTDPDGLVGSACLEPCPGASTLPGGSPALGGPVSPDREKGRSALLPECKLSSFSALGWTGPALWPVPKVFASSRPWEGWGRREHAEPRLLNWLFPSTPCKEGLLVTPQNLSSLEYP